MIEIKGLSKTFGDKTVLNNVNVEFKKGLNFIIGPSGSGKSTLLKIIAGMEKDYSGEVAYGNKDLKTFTPDEMNSYYFNSIGFVWQNFGLIEHLSVQDNIKMVLNLTNESNQDINTNIKSILKQLNIDDLINKKVSTLSGGQKQRVAIARVLVKDPEIIIADEPTGALDKTSSKIIMSVLKKISKERLVIIVTHDTSIIENDSQVYQLSKGDLIQTKTQSTEGKSKFKTNFVKVKLSMRHAFSYAVTNFKGLLFKNILSAIVLTLSSFFLLLNSSGNIVNEQEAILQKLVEEKGHTIREIMLASSVIGAAGTDGGTNQSIDIEQNLSKIRSKYLNDPRIEYFLPVHYVNDMKINIPGLVDNYSVQKSSTVGVFKELVAGRLPREVGYEVAIPKLLVENLKLKPEDVIGKTISFKGMGYDWSSGSPVEKSVSQDELTIVGVVDSTFEIKLPTGEVFKDELEDAFIFSIDSIKQLKLQTNDDPENISFTLRVKDIKDVMPIVEELSKDGITAFGEFESVKDILKINSISEKGASSLTSIIAVLGVVATIMISVINAFLRKYEFAVLKINGYSKSSLFRLNLMEGFILSLAAMVMMVVVFEPINRLSITLFEVALTGANSLIMGGIIILIQGMVMAVINFAILSNINVSQNIMTGDR